MHGVPGIKTQRAQIINPDKYLRNNEDSFRRIEGN